MMPLKTTKKVPSSSRLVQQRKKKKKLTIKSNSSSIKIKPFTKPPALPPNFYESSVNILWKSVSCILEKKPLRLTSGVNKDRDDVDEGVQNASSTRGSPTTSASHPAFSPLDKLGTQTVNISREELFGKVQDLCTHSYGPSLYLELIGLMDKCALSCVSRLASKHNTTSAKSISYATPNCQSFCNKDGEMMVYFTSLTEDDVKVRKVVLENIWKMWSDYVQFLNCVRDIFLSLDRMFIYQPPSNNSPVTQGSVRLRNGGSSVVLSTSSETAENNKGVSTNTCAWTLWDVGMHLLWKHCSLESRDGCTNPSVGATTTEMESADVNSSHDQNRARYSVLDALKVRTISCLLDEVKASSKLVFQENPRYNHTGEDHALFKPLVRDCVSIFRTLGYAAQGTFNKDSTSPIQDFTLHLVNDMANFFSKESSEWIRSASLSYDTTKPTYDTQSLLSHIDSRLKQVNEMTEFYLLSSSLPTIPKSIGHLHKDSSFLHGRSRQSRILVTLVERYLLSPHFTSDYILHPKNLHPLFDQFSKESNPDDVKLLFELSKRVMIRQDTKDQLDHQDSSLPQSNFIEQTGTSLLLSAFALYGRQRGSATVRMQSAVSSSVKSAQTSHKDMQAKIIPNLLKLKFHLESLHIDAFGGEDAFGQVVRSALEDVVNDGGVGGESTSSKNVSAALRRNRNSTVADGGKRVAELLAKHMDILFKNAKSSLSNSASLSLSVKNRLVGGTPPPETDTEAYQNSVIDLFRHIHSKDIFEAFYRRDLAKRLLLGKSTSIDAEKSFVSKLKVECGGAYTSKMVGMFKDMDLSNDVMGSYKAYLGGTMSNSAESTTKGTNMDVDVQVLTTGYWPVYPKYDGLILPSSLENEKRRFEDYYNAKYQGRRIIWQNALGNCIVKAKFPKLSSARELIVNLCQALVLLCFNEIADEAGFTISDIMKKTGMDDRDETERVLQSLSLGREGTRVLIKLDHETEKLKDDDALQKNPRKIRRTVADTDRFIPNLNFKSNQHRIRITNIQMKETTEDRSKINEAVARDRLCLIDAVIVRIMKSRKTLEHKVLLGEVMNQVKFPASGSDIKKRIESLIEREYLQRSEGDRSKYNYLA